MFSVLFLDAIQLMTCLRECSYLVGAVGKNGRGISEKKVSLKRGYDKTIWYLKGGSTKKSQFFLRFAHIEIGFKFYAALSTQKRSDFFCALRAQTKIFFMYYMHSQRATDSVKSNIAR